MSVDALTRANVPGKFYMYSDFYDLMLTILIVVPAALFPKLHATSRPVPVEASK